jgi:hypothetical protein
LQCLTKELAAQNFEHLAGLADTGAKLPHELIMKNISVKNAKSRQLRHLNRINFGT